MTRVKGGSVAKNRRRKVLKAAKGYFGSKHRLFKTAQEQTFHSGVYAYRDRKANKRKEISENYGLQESMLHVVKTESVILNSLLV